MTLLEFLIMYVTKINDSFIHSIAGSTLDPLDQHLETAKKISASVNTDRKRRLEDS